MHRGAYSQNLFDTLASHMRLKNPWKSTRAASAQGRPINGPNKMSAAAGPRPSNAPRALTLAPMGILCHSASSSFAFAITRSTVMPRVFSPNSALASEIMPITSALLA